jgi:hypothetical protein
MYVLRKTTLYALVAEEDSNLHCRYRSAPCHWAIGPKVKAHMLG